MQFIQKIITNLENKKIPLINYFIALLSIILMRDVLEFTLFKQSLLGVRFVHYSLFYIVVFLGLLLILHLASKESYLKIFKTIIPLFSLILLPPVIDKIINFHVSVYHLGYLPVTGYTSLWHEYITIGSGQTVIGSTTGVKIEIVLALIFISLYLTSKKVKFIYNLFAVIASYSLIFSLFAILVILNYFSKIMNLNGQITDQILANLYIILSIIIASIILYQDQTNLFKIIIRQLEIYRVIHVLLLVSFGFWLAFWFGYTPNGLSTIFNLINCYIAAILIWLCVVQFNNIADIKIDKISNTERPLVKDEISLQKYQNITFGFGIVALIIASTISFTSLILMSIFFALTSAYSLEPFRLKRYVFVAKFVEMLGWLTIIMLGFTVINTRIYDFPASISYLVLFFSLAINFIDLKDIPGDRADNIKTLPVLIGEKWAKRLIGFFFILSYLAVYLFFIPNLLVIIPLAIFGLIEYYFINKEDYKEKYVLITYIVSLITLWILYVHIF